MYQLPVGNIEKIRRARKAVKNVLGEIGLEDCQNLLKVRRAVPAANVSTNMKRGYGTRMYKKWPYRRRALCCSMCKYSTQTLNNFTNHVTRHHGNLQPLCSLATCSQCVFVGTPKVVKKHMLLFHSKPTPTAQPQREAASTTHHSIQRYQCRRCGLPSSSLLVMKKHVILRHLNNLAEQYIGYRMNRQGLTRTKIYCCKVCRVNTGNIDHMLRHLLVEPSHYAFSLFAQIINSKPLLIPSNGQAAGTVVTLQQLQGAANGTALICAPGTNQTFLPPQASALVQLASAEAKGLLQPGATIALRGTLSQGTSVVQIPTASNVALKTTPLTLAPPVVQQQQLVPPPQQILIPSKVNANTTVVAGSEPKALVMRQNVPTSQVSLQGTMMTSQSLLTHLIPTGNKVNGMPTYTFAPLQAPLRYAQSTGTPLKAVEQTSNSQPQTKKWITCPLCNELFPSNVYDIHTEVAHQTKNSSTNSESVAARAAFLKKICLHCSTMFFSIKQLVEHIKQHDPTSKTFSDFLRQKFRIYTKRPGGILFPHFDVHTTAPKEVLGDTEVNVALVTSSLDLIYIKLRPSSPPDICPAPAKVNHAFCSFCDEKFQNDAKHLQHLKQKHFVAPTIHAILKTEAFKCIYCNGVYTGKVTQQAVMLHIQRCRSQQVLQQPGVYFLQVPQGVTMKQTAVQGRPILPMTKAPVSEAELQSKKRLEAALKKVIEDNKREREEKAAQRKRHEKVVPTPEPEVVVDPRVKLVMEPTSVDRCDMEERRNFIGKYFNCNPYASRAESEELCKRLFITKQELAAHFSNKRSKCMKSLKRKTSVIFLGFNMKELSKVKHNLFIPEQQPVEPLEQQPEEQMKRQPASSTVQAENSEEEPEAMDQS
uniref:ADNP homeobox 2b n=1 Tax=Cynoglossus semilaevis TaxID=244447 RepID=A0A3P8WLR1_CYNSE